MAEEKRISKFPQNTINSIARLVQCSANAFEVMAEDCEHFNGYGGCKKLTTDGPAESCTPLSCPLGGE